MANFRIYPGLFVRITQEQPGLELGNIYQLLNTGANFNPFLTFVGVKGRFPIEKSGTWMEPVYE